MVDSVYVGGRLVLLSGSIISEDSKPVTIEMRDLKLVFDFQTTKEGRAHFRADQLGPKSLKFNLINFNSSVGIAWDSAIGEVDGKPLVMALMVHSMGPEEIGGRRIYSLHYTFSVGEDYRGG